MIVKVRKNKVKDIIYFLVHVTPGTHVYNEPHPSPIILRGAWTLTLRNRQLNQYAIRIGFLSLCLLVVFRVSVLIAVLSNKQILIVQFQLEQIDSRATFQ